MADLAVVKNALEARSADLAKVVPSSVGSPTFLASLKASAVLAVSQNAQLQRCAPATIYASVLRAATLGLDLNPARRLAYLVPYGQECTLSVGYRGLVALAKRAGAIRKVTARIVHEGDHFAVSYGLHEDLVHEPAPIGSEGNPVAVYAIATTPEGEQVFEVMSWQEVMAIAKKSRSSAWRDAPQEMARKTVLRRLMKYLPDSVEEIDVQMAQEDADDAGNTPLTAPMPPTRKPAASSADRLRSALGIQTPPQEPVIDAETGEVTEEPCAAESADFGAPEAAT